MIRTITTKILLAAGIVAATVAPAGAQSIGKELGSDVRDFGGDVVAVWLSPLHAHPRDWALTLGTFAGGAALSPIDDDVDRYMYRHRYDWFYDKALSPVREGGVMFSGKYIVPVAGAAYVVGLATHNRALRDGFLGCISAYASTSVVRSVVAYNLVARTRPDSARDAANASPPAKEGDQYKIDFGHGGWGRNSFPAGHTANMAACASFLSHRFESRAVATVAYTFAGAVAVGRLVDRRHWTSDSFVGWVFGYAAGKLVAERTLRRERAAGGDATTVTNDRGLYFTTIGDRAAFGWQTTF